MWVIFAGVSILMTTTFVLEDIYYGKNQHEKSRQLMNTRNESTSNNDTPNFLKGQSKPKIPQNWHDRFYNNFLLLPLYFSTITLSFYSILYSVYFYCILYWILYWLLRCFSSCKSLWLSFFYTIRGKYNFFFVK